MAHRRLIWQIFIPFLAVTILAMAAVMGYADKAMRQFYEAQIREELTRMARIIVIEIGDLAGSESVDDLCKRMGRDGEIRVTVIARSGQVLGDSLEDPRTMPNHADRPEVIQALDKGLGSYSRRSPTLGINMMYVAVPIGPQQTAQMMIRTSIATTAMDKAMRDIYTKMLGAGALVAGCAAILSWIISRRINRPITEMQQIAGRFAQGNLDLRAPVAGSLEMQALAESLNAMARQLEQRIRTITDQQREAQAILAAMIEGVIAVDSQGRIVTVNRAAAGFLNIDPAQVQGRSVQEVIRDVGLQQFVNEVLQGQPPEEIQVQLPIQGGRSFQIHGTRLGGGPAGPTQGEGPHGAVIVLHDITRIRRLEDLRKDFVANVSHELKTPITSIKGFVEALIDGHAVDPEEVQRYLGIVARHADRLNAIINDLLTLSRLEEDQDRRRITLELTPVRPILESAIEMSQIKARAKSIPIELECEASLVAQVNSPLLEQAVANLIDNAVKYSEPTSPILIQASQVGPSVSISVQDHGIGIPREHLDRVFERFYVVDKGRSRTLGGTGLGLAIVKHIVQVHGGSVEVRSEPGKGSTFTIHLPMEA
jgi:two-component system, OmpR family, phosphate regulon sensor histidine kinase PhoR